jgi:DNA-binding transcriptional LysR family regulator
VSDSLRVVRVRSRAPSRASKSATLRVKVGMATPISRAPADRLPFSTAASSMDIASKRSIESAHQVMGTAVAHQPNFVIRAAIKGVGVTRVLHYQCADAAREGSLQILLADFELEPVPIHLVHAGRGVLAPKMRVFLDFATGRLRERLSSL